MVWYSHLFQNFPQFLVIHTVKGFGIVNKGEIDVFLELSCFFDVQGQFANTRGGQGKDSIYSKYQARRTDTSSSKDPNSLMSFKGGFLKAS